MDEIVTITEEMMAEVRRREGLSLEALDCLLKERLDQVRGWVAAWTGAGPEEQERLQQLLDRERCIAATAMWRAFERVW